MRTKTLIIGGGVMGVAIAWKLAQRRDPHREPVLLVEKREFAAGASGRSGAILRTQYSDRVLAAMARDSLRVYTNFERDYGRCLGFQKSGVLTLGAGAAQRALIERNAAMMRAIGIDVRVLEAAALRALVPGMSVSDGTLGAYEPDGGGVDPRRTVEAIAALAREHGATLRQGARVERLLFELGAGDARSERADDTRTKRRVRGAIVDGEEVIADEVVVAAGPWTKSFLTRAGIELPLRVVVPEQHFVRMPESSRSSSRTPADSLGLAALSRQPLEEDLEARFRSGAGELPEPAHPVLLDLEGGFYTRCESHTGRTRVGRLDYSQDAAIEDPDLLDEHVSPEFSRWARAKLEGRLPLYRAEPDAGTLAGLYNLTPDAQALIGPLPEVAGLFVVSGFSGHGFKLAPSVGEGVAQLVCGEPLSAFDREFFDPLRFSGKDGAIWGGAFGL